VVLSLQTLPPLADTESDRRCGTEWGWLARLPFYLFSEKLYTGYLILYPLACFQLLDSSVEEGPSCMKQLKFEDTGDHILIIRSGYWSGSRT